MIDDTQVTPQEAADGTPDPFALADVQEVAATPAEEVEPRQQPEEEAPAAAPVAPEPLQPTAQSEDTPAEPETAEEPAAEPEEETEPEPVAAAPESAVSPAPPEPLSLETVVTDPTAPPTQDMNGYWSRVLTGNPSTVPSEIRALAGADDDSLDTEERDYRLLGTINRSWAVDNLGVSKEAVLDGWKDCRSQLAQCLGVADNEQEVFMGLSAREEDKPRREAGRRIFEKAYLAGLNGEGNYDIRSLRDGLDAADRESAESLGLDAFDQGVAARRKWLPLAKRVSRGVEAFAAMEEDFLSAPRVFSAAPDLLQAVDEVADLDEEDRETVLFLAAAIAKRHRPQTGEGLGSRLVRAVRRGAGNIGMGVAQFANHAGIVTLANLGEKWGGETGKAMEKTAAAWDRRATVLHRMRELTQQEISPLYPAESASRAESYLIDAAEASPAAMLAFCGGAGFAALSLSGMGDSVTAARSLAPKGDHELQLAAGILGGAVQGAIYMGMGRLGGRMLEQSIANFMKSRGASVGTFSMNALKSAGAASLHGAELVAAGKLAQATEMGAQELAARLSGTASHIDWKSFGDNLTDIEANMRESAAILPFLLIGSGRVALRHFRSPRAVLGEGLALRDWGIDDATRIEIMRAPDIDVQGSMLCEALRGSRRWSSPGFMPQIARAMNLFNGDYFKGFQDIECVRHFLKLPAERSLLENKVVRERDATAPEVLALSGHANSRDLNKALKTKAKFAEVMQFWDKLYQLSHVAEYTPRHYFDKVEEEMDTPGDDRVNFYRDIMRSKVPTVPFRMRNVGYYNPRGEAERRAMVRDRTQECIDLSYQFLMATHSVDSLMSSSRPVSSITSHLEKARNDVIGQAACAVLDMAMGMKPRDSVQKLSKYLTKHCMHRSYSGTGPMWMRRTVPNDLRNMYKFLPKFSSVFDAHWQDFKNVLRVMSGLNVCARTLVRLLPMTSDFQACIVRGMSPLQTYHHLLVRELGFDPDKVHGYPMDKIKESANNSDLTRFSKLSNDIFETSQRLSGSELEQCVGEDGVTYWRARRPDSGFTRWHTAQKDALNELTISIAPYFGPLGQGIHSWLFQSGAKGYIDLAEMPHASYRDFSGFDQLCSIAMRDLGDYWHRSVTRTLPGFVPTRIRSMQTGQNTKNSLQAQAGKPSGQEAGVDVALDRLSLLTPAQMINGRFLAFWERALKSDFVSVPEVGEFLMQRGYLTRKRYDKIIDLSKVLLYPKNPNTPLKLTPPPDIAGMHREMAQEMARFHSLYYFAHLQQQNLPESVKMWFRLAPFCPDMPEEDYSPGHRVRFGRKGVTAIAWANRHSAMQLKKLAPEVETMRRQITENPVPEGRIAELFRQATGESESSRYEQSWCYHYSGPGVFRGTPRKDWNLILDPLRTWKLLSAEEKQDARKRLESFCLEDPTQDALDAAGRGEKVDYLEYSLRQLDGVLKRFPDLHRYAPSADTPQEIRVLQLRDTLPQHDPDAEPDTEPVPLRWLADFDGAYSVDRLQEVPEELAGDEEALSSLRFLDTLRRLAIRRPYALNSGIWWGNKLYGGQFGLHPKGLESWQREEPLEPLFQLLGNIHKTCRDTGADSLSVCGVKLRGAEWSKLDFDELATASIYRFPGIRSRVYRLMPGYPDSPNVLVRSPYVVPCHSGAYMNGHRVIRREEDLFRSFCPLDTFSPSRLRYLSAPNLKIWRNVALDPVLDAIADHPSYLKATGNAQSGIVGMGELLLRLCEDTGFCHTFDPNAPQELDRQQAHIVNIATAMLECMRQGGSEASVEGLLAAVTPMKQDPYLRHYILRTLRDSSDKVKADARIHNPLLKHLELNWEELEEEEAALQQQREEDDASVDTSRLRQGELWFGDDEK